MTDHKMSQQVRDYYNDVNKNLSLKTEINYHDLTPRVADIVRELGEDVLNRYLGSGMIIPENITGARILDIGCGSGSLVFVLSKIVGPTGYVVGVDISDGLIDTCKKTSEYHWKKWGYSKANFEFHAANAERLLEMNIGEFDAIVSNGVLCLIPDKDQIFEAISKLLKPGGQFYLNDVFADVAVDESLKDNVVLWSLGATGSIVWGELKNIAEKYGLQAPYLTSSVGGVTINDKYQKMLGKDARYICASWRMFKIPAGPKRGATTATYKGTIEDFPDLFQWDISTSFPKGKGVNIDGELATLLANTNFKDHFTFADFSGSVTTKRNQDPFERLAELDRQGRKPKNVYTIEDH